MVVLRVGRNKITSIVVTDVCEGNASTSIPDAVTRWGANELVAQLEGPELHAAVLERVADAKYAGSCTYEASWAVHTPGTYLLLVLRTRTRYAAVNEDAMFWPELSYDAIVNRTVHIQWQMPCKDGTRRPHGTWVAKAGANWSVPGHRPGRSREDSVWTTVALDESSAHQPATLNTYSWQSTCGGNSPSPPRLTPSHARQLKVLFVGDSHVRTAFLDVIKLVGVVGQSNDPATVGHKWTESWCAESDGRKSQWCFRYNNMGTCEPDLNAWDAVLWNFGQHHASGRYHATFNTYAAAVAHAIFCIKRQNATVAWMDSPPLPLRNDPWVHAYKDWRSFHRLAAFNAHSGAQFRDAGMPVLSLWEATLPLINKLDDGAHFPLHGTHELIVDFLASRLGQEAFRSSG